MEKKYLSDGLQRFVKTGLGIQKHGFPQGNQLYFHF